MITAPPTGRTVTSRTLGTAGLSWALAYVPIHVYWGLGGTSTPIGITGEQSGFRAANWGACVVIVGAGLVCLALTSRWGDQLPGGLLRGAAWVGGLFGLAHWLLYTTYCALRVSGLVGYPTDSDLTLGQLRAFDWANLGYFELWFGVMGVLLIVCARRSKARDRLRPPRPRIRRVGSAISLAGIVIVLWGVFTFDPWTFAVLGPAVVGIGLLCAVGPSAVRVRVSDMGRPDTQYEELLRLVLENGTHKDDRTGTGTRSVFGHQLRYNLADGFPLITTKRVHFRSVAYELLWFLRGESNVKWLQDNKVTIWDEWADAGGELGPVYGVQWRSWPTPDGRHIDQITQVLQQLRSNPNSRRLIVSAWNVGEIENMALPPCHAFFQFYVADGRLSCQLYQRSADLFLGVPFNIASYALLTHMVAAQVGLEVGDFVWTGGDCHIYDNHLEQVRTQLSRHAYPFPTLRLRPVASLFDYAYEDFEVVGYEHHPPIKAPVAV